MASSTSSAAAAALAQRVREWTATHRVAPRVDPPQPAALRGVVLHAHQREGVEWLNARRSAGFSGCVLADDMGLGKTLEAIGLLARVAEEGDAAALVVAPLTVTESWRKEFARFAPQMRVVSLAGDREARAAAMEAFQETAGAGGGLAVLLTSYEHALGEAEWLARREWAVLVVDEAQRIKNADSALFRALDARCRTRFRLLMTGTPVQNRVEELWALLRFVAPTLFDDAAAFRAAFAHLQRLPEGGGGGDDDAAASPEIVRALHEVLAPFMLRRVKSQVNLSLPPKRELVLFASLTEMQKRLYRAVLARNRDALGAGNARALMNVVASLRKACNHPYLFHGVEPEPFHEGAHLWLASGKFALLDRVLAHLRRGGHRVLVFSQSTRTLDILQDYFACRGFSYERLDGSVRGEERFIATERFARDAETFAFLLSTRAGGVGLTLTAADTVIFVDSDWNPQAQNRAHRIGQTRPVTVLRLVSANTCEEAIELRNRRKLRLAEAVLSASQRGAAGDAAGEEKRERGEGEEAESASRLREFVQFGLDKMFAESAAAEALSDHELARLLDGDDASAREGAAVVVTPLPRVAASPSPPPPSSPPAAAAASESLFVFEGVDYGDAAHRRARAAEAAEDEALERALEARGAACARALEEVLGEGGEEAEPQAESAPKRRRVVQRSPEERAALRAAREAARREEAERRRAAREERRLRKWAAAGYESAALEEEEEEEEEEEGEATAEEGEGEEDAHARVFYVVGDASHPEAYVGALPAAQRRGAIILMCVDDSGRWGSGGFFGALSRLSPRVKEQYEAAGAMRDLRLGDAHLFELPIAASLPPSAEDTHGSAAQQHLPLFVALVVAQRRTAAGVLSGVRIDALTRAVRALRVRARADGLSVHLPRIGAGTPGFDWYAIERVLRRHLAERGVPVFVYYFRRARSSLGASSPPAAAASSSFSSSSAPPAPSSSSPPPAPSSSSSSPPAAPAAPSSSVFAAHTFFFDRVLPETRRTELHRLAVAYGGRVEADPSPLVDTFVSPSRAAQPLLLEQCAEGCRVVSPRWLEASVASGRALAADVE